MTAFYLWVPGNAVGQPRVKARGRLAGGKVITRVYTPETAKEFKAAIAREAKRASLAGKLLTGPIKVQVHCQFSRPKSHYGTGRNAAKLKPNAPHWHTQKPDGDNIIKAVKDILTDVGVWGDDKQVADERTYKTYTCGTPATAIEIALLEEPKRL